MNKGNALVIILIIILLAIIGYFTYNYYQKSDSKGAEVTTIETTISDIETVKEVDIEEEKTSYGYFDVDAENVKKLIDTAQDLVIIDVSPNFAKGHIPESINYYVGDGSLDNAIPTLDKNNKYLIYCHVDSASISGSQKMIDAGFSPVYRLKGNYAAWIDAGYPVEK